MNHFDAPLRPIRQGTLCGAMHKHRSKEVSGKEASGKQRNAVQRLGATSESDLV